MMRRFRRFHNLAFMISSLALLLGGLMLTEFVVSAATVDGGGGQPEGEEDVEARPATPQVVITRVLANGVEVLKQEIPGVEYVTVLVEFKTGDNHDPKDGPGLGQFLIDLAATGPLAGDAEPTVLAHRALDRKYPRGWSAQAHADHTILGYVIPAAELRSQLTATKERLQTVEFSTAAIDRSMARVHADLERRFTTEIQLIPTSWVMAKAFRHNSGAMHGFSPEALGKLSASRLTMEWGRRIHPRNIRLHLTGNLGENESALNSTIEETFGALTAATPELSEFALTVRAAEGRERRRRIQVNKLPSPKEHAVAAYYAPAINDPDHPAFLTVSNKLMASALRLPGAQSRVVFQYSLLLDPRAAYLTPHHWRFPKGASQALGFWTKKIENTRFTHADGRSTLRRLAWELGADLDPAVIDEINRTPAVLFTIAYASANRARSGEGTFWEDYRNNLARLRKEDLALARDKYFLANSNIAVFILTPPAQ